MKIDHIGIATRGIQDAMTFYRDALGLDVAEIEEVAAQKVRVAMLPIGESRIELLEATSSESPVSKFIEKKGEGIHHIAFDVKDIHAEMKRLKEEGFVLLNDEPKPGADNKLVCFLHPKSTNGVLIELCMEKKTSS